MYLLCAANGVINDDDSLFYVCGHSLFYVCGVNKTSSELSLTKTKINEYINEILNTEQ